ncbi:MAG: penicillin-binding protein 1C [Proteobacteria bacterium]|nr:penicillin-binding protein 1C [Pseudomonadota bacterium]
MGVSRPLRVLAAGLALPVLALGLIWGGFRLYAASLPPLDLAALEERSAVVLDRNGKLLRPFAMASGRWRLPITAEEVDPRYLAMLIAYEDRRFWQHSGVDPVALVRAGWQMLRSGRIVSGGSTLSMQVARLAEPREARSLGAKLRQMARAVELENRLGKKAILDLYLSLAPFGGNLEGLRAASLAYFGREPHRLSTAQAALLVAIPQSPETRRPDRHPRAAERARAMVLARIEAAGTLPAPEVARARDESLPEARHAFPQHAAHRAEALMAENPAARRIATTLDRDWQANLAHLARERAEALGPKLSVAIVVIEHATGAVRASIGGAEYLASDRAGGMDLTRAIRSPGSALKPFIYALAFEDGLAHPETMLEDRPMRFSGYAPENFDPGFQGMVSARQALQMSLNLPVVDLLSAYGPQRFITRLKESGADIQMPRTTASGDLAAPGLAVALGGLGITLQDLTTLFAGLARGGEMIPAQERPQAVASGIRLFGSVPAWYVADILRFAPPPDNGASGRIAFKTGTSYGYRDAFAVGFDRRHTIGVWVGRADNAAVPGLVGRKVAAPILFDAFARIGLQPGIGPRPPDALVASNAQLPPPLRHLRKDQPKTLSALADQPLSIAFPPDGASIDLAASEVEGRTALAIKLQGGVGPYTCLLDGTPVAEAVSRRHFDLEPKGKGFSQISVVDSRGQTAIVRVRFQ